MYSQIWNSSEQREHIGSPARSIRKDHTGVKDYIISTEDQEK